MKSWKNNEKRIFVILGLIVLISITGCISNKENQENVTDVNITHVVQTSPGQEVIGTPVPKGTSDAGTSSSSGGVMQIYSLDKLVSMSDSIVIAEVVSVLPSRWNTKSGEKPTVNNGSTIYTDANIKIVESLKGSLSGTSVTVRVIGGTVGQDKQYAENQPLYSVNEKVLVFLKNDNDPRTKDVGNSHMITAGLMQGKIYIPANNEIIIGDTKMSLDEARVIIAGKGEKKYGSI